MVGRLKESLGRALCQYPMFTGRVRWAGPDEGRDGRELVIVSNDSGMRLVEAKYPMHMDEFLRLEDREAAESELVYWDDLKEQDPQFCPLAYIQVTDFECGGYSIGLSLSALLGDTSELSGFLEHLAATHLDIFFKQNKLPAFYLPKRKSTKLYPVPNNLARRRHAGQTLLYRIHNPESSTAELNGLALSCIKDAERKLGVDLGPDFELTLCTKDGSTGDLAVEKCKGLTWVGLNALPKLNGAKWDDKIFDQVTFWEGHKPVRGAYWIGLGVDEGLVMVYTSPLGDSAIHITVSVP
uniref:Uncharacterized protein n=1 Tax=Kalanchoe fedtschenkoi TaxID=63787 RepID=A0A7N0V494_KALFE